MYAVIFQVSGQAMKRTLSAEYSHRNHPGWCPSTDITEYVHVTKPGLSYLAKHMLG